MTHSLKRCGRAVRTWWSSHSDHRLQLDQAYKLAIVALVPLVAVALLEPLFMADDMHWLRQGVEQSGVFGPLFFPKSATIEWKDRVQGLLLLMGLPVAFCLWHWRDRNVRDQIENQRKDINLKEFQEVQLRAAGALDEKLPAEAREQLQIAALHQLRGFLRGDYGDSFRRPAFELLLAGHAAAMERIGLKRAIEEARAKTMTSGSNIVGATIVSSIEECFSESAAVDRERLHIIRDERCWVFDPAFPLSGRCFDRIETPAGALLGGLDLSGSTFVGAYLTGVHIEGASLGGAHLEGAYLIGAYLNDACLSEAHLEGAKMFKVHLGGANLGSAHLEGADLREAHLNRVSLVDAHLEGADLRGARLQEANLLDAQLEGADLRDAHLIHANLSRSSLRSALLSGANLDGANLRYANLERANLMNASLKNADLSRADWQKALLAGATFNDSTTLLGEWHEIDQTARNSARDAFRELGARHIDDFVA